MKIAVVCYHHKKPQNVLFSCTFFFIQLMLNSKSYLNMEEMIEHNRTFGLYVHIHFEYRMIFLCCFLLHHQAFLLHFATWTWSSNVWFNFIVDTLSYKTKTRNAYEALLNCILIVNFHYFFFALFQFDSVKGMAKNWSSWTFYRFWLIAFHKSLYEFLIEKFLRKLMSSCESWRDLMTIR